MAQFSRRAIFRRVEPFPGLLDVIELQNDQPAGCPVSFENLGLTAARQVFPSIRSDGGWGKSFVVLIARRVIHVDVDDNICWHIGFSSYYMFRWNQLTND